MQISGNIFGIADRRLEKTYKRENHHRKSEGHDDCYIPWFQEFLKSWDIWKI